MRTLDRSGAAARMITYPDFVEEVTQCRNEIDQLMDALDMHENERFRSWRHHLAEAIRQIEEQGYRIACDVRARRFGTYDPYVTSNPGREALVRSYKRDLTDTANELNAIIEYYNKYGVPKWHKSAPAPVDSKVPEKLTLNWLFRNATLSFWLWAVGVLAATFTVGLWFSSTDLYAQLKGSTKIASPAEKQ